MAIAAGEIVTASRLNRMQTRMYHAIGSGTVAAGSTNVDVPSATVTLVTEANNATYQVTATWDFDLSGATTNAGSGRLVVDGVGQSPSPTFAAEVVTDRSTVSATYNGTLATAGSHTLKLQASTPATNMIVQGTGCTIAILINEVV